jgi:hypothetical protein
MPEGVPDALDDDDDDADDVPVRAPVVPELDFDVDALAAALQTPAPRGATAAALDDDPLDGDDDPLGGDVDPLDGDDDLRLSADPGEAEDLGDDIEELDELLELPEDPTYPRRLYLVVDGRVHAVTTERFVIGRVSSQCDLAIIDANISRQHCAIERRDGLFFVVDLGSTNGIVVDGVRVDDHPIADGDVLVLSGHRVECSFEPPELEPADAPPDEVAAPSSVAGAVTGRLAAVPIARAPQIHTQPEPEPEPELPAPEPETFEERVELRLASMAADLATLTTAVQRLVEQVEALEGVDALAKVIQRRLEQSKRGG